MCRFRIGELSPNQRGPSSADFTERTRIGPWRRLAGVGREILHGAPVRVPRNLAPLRRGCRNRICRAGTC